MFRISFVSLTSIEISVVYFTEYITWVFMKDTEITLARIFSEKTESFFAASRF